MLFAAFLGDSRDTLVNLCFEPRTHRAFGVDEAEHMMPAAKHVQSLRWLVALVLLGVGVPLRLRSPERGVFEGEILYYFSTNAEFRRALIVGCDWYTKRYERLFRGKQYVTIEVDPGRRPFSEAAHRWFAGRSRPSRWTR